MFQCTRNLDTTNRVLRLAGPRCPHPLLVAMVKDFGPEAQQAVNANTQAAFSNYRIRFIKPDVAVADALLTVRNVNGPDGTIIPVIPVNFFFVAVRHGDRWLIQDGRSFRVRATFEHDQVFGVSKLA